MRRAENGGLCTSRHGSAAACRSVATAGRTVSRTRRLRRWLRAIADAEVTKIRAQNARILAETEDDERRRRRKGCRFKLPEDKRNQAVQAFWAMHVEMLNWSGMTVMQYTAATKLSKYSPRRWRELIDNSEVAIDYWRARLHPSARPKISSGVSSAAKNLRRNGVDRPADGRSAVRSAVEPTQLQR